MEGGGWYAGAPVFLAALTLWWAAGVGLLRGSRRSHRLGLAMLAAFFGFGLVKLLYYHEQASYVFQAVTLVIAALTLARPTRAWIARRGSGA
jgi:hypothetical protein